MCMCVCRNVKMGMLQKSMGWNYGGQEMVAPKKRFTDNNEKYIYIS